jgi:hypothetical protein
MLGQMCGLKRRVYRHVLQGFFNMMTEIQTDSG